MINDIISAFIDFVQGCLFNNFADNLLTYLQALIINTENIQTYLNPAITSLRVITYFVPAQHVGVIVSILSGVLAIKCVISLYKAISPFSS